jgi:multimeric flavodoxin WrbA
MAEIYERWVKAHGVLIVTPVYWYGAPGGLKVMIDRLVCADGGNPDPTSTAGKDPKKGERRSSSRAGHIRSTSHGRAFAVVVHGDVAGVDSVRRGLVDWLRWMKLIPAGRAAKWAATVGFYEPYATSHERPRPGQPLPGRGSKRRAQPGRDGPRDPQRAGGSA